MTPIDAPFALVRRWLPKRPGWFYAVIMAVVAVALAAFELREERGKRNVDRLLEGM